MADGLVLTFVTLIYIYFYCLISVHTFGYENRYTCHCNNNNRCDDYSGRCINAASCQQGWYGSTCQKENVALNKPTYSNTQYEDGVSSYAVDGDTTHYKAEMKCFHAGVYTPGIPNYWQVDLQYSYPIRDIQIYLRSTWKDRLRGFYINTDRSSNTRTACRPPANNIPGSVFTITVNCEGRYLRLSNTGLYNQYAHVNLCELEVFVCSPGTYGSDCTLFCFCKSPTDRCTDGVCPSGCVPGYTGNSCNTRCYGASCKYKCRDRKCSNPSSLCNITIGECNGGCQNGYKLPDCVEFCDIGVNYGVNCSKLCSGRECFNKESSCDHFDGRCDNYGCSKGYKGSDCTHGCRQSMEYGRNCKYRCNARNCLNPSSSCDVKTGVCVGGCKIGYKPPDCRQKCDRSYKYGDQCLKKCSDRKCLRTSTCDYRTGACYNQQCEAGNQGIDCTQVCDVGVNYGDRCSNMCSERNCLIDRSSCDYITGKCEGGCKPGYREIDCKQKCDNDYYGDKCSQMCSERYCINPSSCDHITGKCEGGCKNNKYGVDCTLDCPVGFYGDGCTTLCDVRKCKPQSDVCQTSDGSCATGCLAGYVGVDCTSPCSSDVYGDRCNQTCESRECKIFSNTCNHEDGSCGVDGCLPGYQLKDCSQECTGRTYGLGCTFNCDHRNCENNTICDISTGRCEGSCKDGFELDDCTQTKEPIGAIVGSVLAVVFAALIVIIVVIVVRRRKGTHHISKETDNCTLPTRKSDDHQYDVFDAGNVYEDVDSVVGVERVTKDTNLADKPASQAKPKQPSSSVEPTVPVPETPSNYYYNLPATKLDDVPTSPTTKTEDLSITEWNA